MIILCHVCSCFYDYKKAISNPNLLKIALQYVAPFNGLVFSFPDNKYISGNGVMNEHITSTKIGLKGIPALSEELSVAGAAVKSCFSGSSALIKIDCT